MRIIVIGAGVVGVTTAYLLAQSGHQVTVIEAQKEVASEASHANGGQLSYDFASPMATPSLMNKFPSILAGKDIAFRVRPKIDLNFLSWSLCFVQNCLPVKARLNEEKLSQLAHSSGEVLQEILSQAELKFNHRKAGKLVIYENERTFNSARAALKKSSDTDCRFNAISANECMQIEPALMHHTGQLVGGVYAEFDEVGDAALFTSGLAELCRSQFDVQFLMEEMVLSFHQENGRIQSLSTDKNETIVADAYICCLGTDENNILSRLGVNSQIYPIKGYSLTLPLGDHVPEVAITDAKRKLVYSRIGDRVRIAGFADFGFKSPENDGRRIELLRKEASLALPCLADFDSKGSEWVGLRPSTPDSLPIVGRSKYENLYLNMGHGMFGWTLAAGTAKSITQNFIPATKGDQKNIDNAA